MPKSISKSQFNLSRQCHKAFHMYRHRKELLAHSKRQLKVMQSGTEFGALMQQRYPGGVDVSQESAKFYQRFQLTDAYLQRADRPIYEASLSTEVEGVSLMCMVDILVPEGDGWHLVEVKSGTSAKDTYIADAYFQCFVAQKKGLRIKRLSILHANNQYVREGALDVQALGTLHELDLNTVPDITAEVAGLQQIDSAAEPEVGIGAQCNKPYECGFKQHCWKDFPKQDNVFALLPEAKAMEQVALGNYDLDQVDPKILSGKSAERFKAWKNGTWIWKQDEVDSFLGGIDYPAYYLDFESINPVVPPYNGTRPYQQTCFQYSLHIQKEQGGPCTHHEFLARPEEGDPRLPFVQQLISDMGRSGSVLVYNKAFEQTRLKELAEAFSEYAEALLSINERMIDLLVPFRSLDIYHPKMGRSASLKDVLPVLVPGMGYAGMEVADGGMAIDAYLELIYAPLTDEERQLKREALLAYCKQDTWAMVKMVERINQGLERY